LKPPPHRAWPRLERRQPRQRAGRHLRLVEARSNEFHRQRKACGQIAIDLDE
jgi:hypothetical protein